MPMCKIHNLIATLSHPAVPEVVYKIDLTSLPVPTYTNCIPYNSALVGVWRYTVAKKYVRGGYFLTKYIVIPYYTGTRTTVYPKMGTDKSE